MSEEQEKQVNPTEPTEEPTTEPTEEPTQATEPTEPETTPTTTPTEEGKKEDEIEDTLQKSGFDYVALEQEYIEKGDLTQETREKLNKLGFTDEFINDFINGKKALYEQELNELASSVGGREEYDKVIDWAGKNLSAGVVQSINSVRDKNILKEFILPTLKGRMEDSEGVAPKVVIQGSGEGKGVEVFESQQQMFEAIRDPRYKKDPAYRDKVTAKVRASREAGIDLGI